MVFSDGPMDTTRAKRVLLSLDEHTLRARWLLSQLSELGPAAGADLINAIAEERGGRAPRTGCARNRGARVRRFRQRRARGSDAAGGGRARPLQPRPPRAPG